MDQMSLQQQTFALSFMANLANGENCYNSASDAEMDIAESTYNSINSILKTDSVPDLMGTWEIVWGPSVMVEEVEQVNNSQQNCRKPNALYTSKQAMYVAKKANTSSPTYVVAIAGTNGSAFSDLFQDGKIELKDWPFGGLSEVQITAGTIDGVTNLLNMKDTLSTSGSPHTLQEFLHGLEKQAQLIFAGHSLGGALAPALGMAIMNPDGKHFDKVKELNFDSKLYASAGPDIGNDAYVTELQKLFMQGDISSNIIDTWNVKIWNSLDIVPQAWVQSNIDKLPYIYKNIPGVPCPFPPATCFVSKLRGLQNFAPWDPDLKSQFSGTERDEDISCGSDHPKLDSWAGEALYQHVNAYLTLILPEEFISAIQSHLDNKLDPCKASALFAKILTLVGCKDTIC